MAKNFIIVEDESVEKAVEKGCRSLKVSPEDVEVEVLQPGRRGLIFSTPFKVKLSIRSEALLDQRFKGQELKILHDLEDAQTLLGNRDGSIAFEKDSSGVFVTVQPPSGEGRTVTVDDVYAHIQSDSAVINVDNVAIHTAFQPQNYGKRTRIADYVEEMSEDRDAEIAVIIARDLMSAAVRVTPPRGNGLHPAAEKIREALRRENVLMPPDEDALQNLLVSRRYNEDITICKGKPAENGDDACIRWVIGDTDRKETQVVREDGSVDFRKMFELNNVKANALLGVLQPATPGTDGRDVLGQVITARPGLERQQRVGKNVRVDEAGEKYYATIDGQFSREHGLGSVLPVFEVTGDLDYHHGDVEFFGTVMIHGHVIDGFTVNAGGNVFVMGTVQEATIMAGGQVIVSGGFLGKQKGTIRAGSDVLVKFAEGGTIEAGENVIVENAIMHAQVRCGGKVEVKSRKGQIVGGNVLARDEIYAKNIGTHLGTKTYLTVGVDMMTRDRLDEIQVKYRETDGKITKLEQSMSHMNAIVSQGGALTEKQKELAARIQDAIDGLATRLDELDFEKETLEASVAKRKRGIVRAYETIFPGVHVTIRGVNYHVKTDIKSSTLTLDGDDVRISPL